MKEPINKNITIPFETVQGLLILAAKEGIVTKPYMEKVLIDHEAKLNPLNRKPIKQSSSKNKK